MEIGKAMNDEIRKRYAKDEESADRINDIYGSISFGQGEISFTGSDIETDFSDMPALFYAPYRPVRRHTMRFINHWIPGREINSNPPFMNFSLLVRSGFQILESAARVLVSRDTEYEPRDYSRWTCALGYIKRAAENFWDAWTI